MSICLNTSTPYTVGVLSSHSHNSTTASNQVLIAGGASVTTGVSSTIGITTISSSTIPLTGSYSWGSPRIELSGEFLTGLVEALKKHPEIAKALVDVLIVDSVHGE